MSRSSGFNKWIYLILILLLSISYRAQDVRVNAVLDTSKIRIGEQVKLDLYLSYDANQKDFKITWPSISDTLTSDVEVISVGAIDTTIPDKTNPSFVLQHQQLIITVYDSGYFAIPGLPFILNNDTTKIKYTETLILEVHTVPTDSSAANLKDIKPPFAEAFNWKWYLSEVVWSGVIILLVAILILIHYFVNYNKKVIYIAPEKPKVPPHITALSSLQNIKEKEIWKEDKVKEYYSEISDAVRLYIEERFQINALESTTDEIMTAFRSQVLDKESKDKLQQLLRLSDLVKFAKQFPIEIEHQFTLQNAFDFVNGTKREEVVDLPETNDTTNTQNT